MGAYLPLSQFVQEPSSEAYWPSLHELQLVWSVLGAAPVPQVAHSVRPKASLNLPLGQGAQAVDASMSTWYVAGGQSR